MMKLSIRAQDVNFVSLENTDHQEEQSVLTVLMHQIRRRMHLRLILSLKVILLILEIVIRMHFVLPTAQAVAMSIQVVISVRNQV